MQIRFDSRPSVADAFTAIAVGLCILLCGATAAAESIPETVVDIRVEGTETIDPSWILQKIQTQPGRQISERLIREDKRKLLKTRLFAQIQTRFEDSPRGAVLIFDVREQAIVRSVEFVGNKKIKAKVLHSWTGLEPGSPFDHMANQEALHRIEEEYKEKGYYHVKTRLIKGDKSTDRDVVIEIREGPVVRVARLDFEGVEQLWDKRVKTKLITKQSIAGLFRGIYRPETLAQDEAAILKYYRDLGFFDVRVKSEPLFSKDGSKVRVVYQVHEGQRSKVGRILYEGNERFTAEELRKEPRLKEGDPFSANDLAKDVRDMMTPYWDEGHTYAQIVPVPLFTEQPGIVDIKFQFDEDRQRFIRYITPEIAGDSPYTQESVVLNRLGLRPGDLADPRLINRARSRLNGGGLFQGVNLVHNRIDPETSMLTAGSADADERVFRGQQPIASGHSKESWVRNSITSTPAVPPSIGGYSHATPRSFKSRPVNQRLFDSPTQPYGLIRPQQSTTVSYGHSIPQEVSYRPVATEYFHRPWGSLLTSQIERPATAPVIRAQNPGTFLGGNQVLQGGPYAGQFSNIPPPGWVDIETSATEGRTGRLMFGAGVNSDNGIVGSFVWEENNFDLFNPPASFSDIVNGQAFRGRGQRFRLEAAPGDIVSRYAVNWVDQYFMNTDNSLSVSGFIYNRFFDDWEEERAGGRVGVGRQISPTDSVSATLRLEEVVISNPRAPVPGQLAAVVGSNFLATVRLAATNDTRDAAIMPADGHYLEGGVEQAFGDFTYSRIDLEGRKFFTLFRRPDDSGKQVLTLSTNLGFATNDTPVFERYYAGGFQSFRGFAFRGVSPQVGVVDIGGTFQALGTVEYRVPVTADDMVHFVTFADIGTVDNRVSFDRFRATVGVGLRVTIPAMGQVPLAFDFGFPVASEAFDDERIFSFYVGILN